MNKQKQKLLDILCQSGALRSNVEGSLPNYVAAVLREYIGQPVEIYGQYINSPKTFVSSKLKEVYTENKVTEIGSIKILRVVGEEGNRARFTIVDIINDRLFYNDPSLRLLLTDDIDIDAFG